MQPCSFQKKRDPRFQLLELAEAGGVRFRRIEDSFHSCQDYYAVMRDNTAAE